jgi:predicted phosphodiesterase
MRQVYTQEQRDLIKRLKFVEKLSNRDIAFAVTGDTTKESSIRGVLKTIERLEGIPSVATIEHQKTSLLTHDELKTVAALNGTVPPEEVATDFGIPTSIVKRIWDGMIVQGVAPLQLTEMDKDSRMYYDKLAKTTQRQRDLLRVERKHNRESNRVVTMLEELTTALTNSFSTHSLSDSTIKHPTKEGSVVGVLQLSDIHFGERIVEVADNVFDTSVVAARLKKFVSEAKKYFKAKGVTSVLVAMTGDLINSDRRLDEIVSNAANRADIVFVAVDILQQVILDLNSDFNVTVASICGNESRIGKDVGWVNYIASDSFDAIIHNILSRLFVGSSGVHFIEIDDPLECVVSVNGANFLLIHGHNGLANTARTENEVAKLKAKYTTRGVTIDYVICGHIHQSYVSDLFARSSGLPGGNAYSDKALNLASRSSQNIYLVDTDKSVHGIKIDLQNYDESFAYSYNKNAEAYKPLGSASNTVVIQSVVI